MNLAAMAVELRNQGYAAGGAARGDVWPLLFGNRQPVEVEIGPGTGTFLLAAAAERPETNFFAIENSHSRTRALQTVLDMRGLPNVRVIQGDAACIVARLVPDDSVAAYHVYFPDPWWKRRHQRRRLFSVPFVQSLARTLVAGGTLHLATDVEDVFALMRASLNECRSFVRRAGEAEGGAATARPLTSFERKGLARGATIHRAVYFKAAPGTPAEPSYASSAAPITPAESPS